MPQKNCQEFEELKLEGLDLLVGDTKLTFCPFCRATHENKLALTRTEEGLAYHCHRASCHESGYVGSSSTFIAKKPKQFKPKKFYKPLSLLPDSLYKHLQSLYELDRTIIDQNGVRLCRQENSLYMPVYNKEGATIGAVTKLLKRPEKGLKTCSYWYKDYPKLFFPRGELFADPVVLVEDSLSAMKLRQFTNSCALLGTHLSDQMAVELARYHKEVIWALDPDATDKAVSIAKRYGFLFSSKIQIMEADPKDTPIEVLRSMFSGK